MTQGKIFNKTVNENGNVELRYLLDDKEQALELTYNDINMLAEHLFKGK